MQAALLAQSLQDSSIEGNDARSRKVARGLEEKQNSEEF
jgi:hypothetical protein